MNNPVTAFNPARFTDLVVEDCYARAWGPGARLKRERKAAIDWLRKKTNGKQAVIELADKLEGCKPHARCKSAACPECSYAARQLVTEVARQFLSDQPSSETIVCVSIVPADGATKPGNLTKDQHARNVRRWKEALGRAGVTWFIGGSDWSLNEHDEDSLPRPLVPPPLRVCGDHRSREAEEGAPAPIPEDRRDPAAGEGPGVGRQEAAHPLHAEARVLAADRYRRRRAVRQGQRRAAVLSRHRQATPAVIPEARTPAAPRPDRAAGPVGDAVGPDSRSRTRGSGGG